MGAAYWARGAGARSVESPRSAARAAASPRSSARARAAAARSPRAVCAAVSRSGSSFHTCSSEPRLPGARRADHLRRPRREREVERQAVEAVDRPGLVGGAHRRPDGCRAGPPRSRSATSRRSGCGGRRRAASRGPGPAWSAHQSTTMSRRRRHRAARPASPSFQTRSVRPRRAHEPVHPVHEVEVGVGACGAGAVVGAGVALELRVLGVVRRRAGTRRRRRASSGPGTGPGTRGSARARSGARPGSVTSSRLRSRLPRAASWRPGWSASAAPMCPGMSISGITRMWCAAGERHDPACTWRFVRCGSDTISGCERLSIRKPWSSEKCRCSWFSLR